jgi:hypothetical protein
MNIHANDPMTQPKNPKKKSKKCLVMTDVDGLRSSINKAQEIRRIYSAKFCRIKARVSPVDRLLMELIIQISF